MHGLYLEYTEISLHFFTFAVIVKEKDVFIKVSVIDGLILVRVLYLPERQDFRTTPYIIQ